jgi:hypothetical protein
VRTHDIGRFAWNWIRLDKRARTYSVAKAYEIDEPYRGSRSVILRLAGTRGIVLHHWETNPESLEDDGLGRWIERHLLLAINSQKGSQRYQDSVTIDDDALDVEIYDGTDDKWAWRGYEAECAAQEELEATRLGWDL